MFRRFHAWMHRVPWGKMGTAVVALAALVEFLDQVSGIDISPVVSALGYDPAVVIAAIGITKIALRVILTFIPPPEKATP